MRNDLDYKKSFWRSELLEFCEDVLIQNRKNYKITQNRISSLLGLNQSEVSRIERGVTIPKDITTIESICELYKLTPAQKSKYLELTCGQSKLNDTDYMSSLIDNQTDFIANLNRSGSPILAIQQTQNLLAWIENNFEDKNVNNSAIIDKICHLLLEESAAWWDVVVPEKTPEKTDNLIKRMEGYTKDNANPSLAANYLDTNKGFHSYIKGDYVSAKSYFDKVVNSKLLENKLWGYEVLRAYTITLGKLKNGKQLSNIENKVFDLINNPSVGNTDKGYMLEGLGQSYIDFDTGKSQQFFELAFKYINEARKAPNFLTVRYVQLTRSYLLLLKRLSNQKYNLLNIATPALQEAEKSGLIRHKLQIESLIK